MANDLKKIQTITWGLRSLCVWPGQSWRWDELNHFHGGSNDLWGQVRTCGDWIGGSSQQWPFMWQCGTGFRIDTCDLRMSLYPQVQFHRLPDATFFRTCSAPRKVVVGFETGMAHTKWGALWSPSVTLSRSVNRVNYTCWLRNLTTETDVAWRTRVNEPSVVSNKKETEVRVEPTRHDKPDMKRRMERP